MGCGASAKRTYAPADASASPPPKIPSNASVSSTNGSEEPATTAAFGCVGATGAARSPKPASYRSGAPKAAGDGSTALAGSDAAVPDAAANGTGPATITEVAGQSWKVEDVDGQEQDAPSIWWSTCDAGIHKKSLQIVEGYNSFFDHIGLRKGWRTAPFVREEVEAPFRAAAEIVAVVRSRLDEQAGEGLVLRQLEGSAMNFLWGWTPGRSLVVSHDVLVEFVRGLVFATLSDGRGLVEGLDDVTIEYYVGSHPLLVKRVTEVDVTETDVTEADVTKADVTKADAAEADVAEAHAPPAAADVAATTSGTGTTSIAPPPEVHIAVAVVSDAPSIPLVPPPLAIQ